MVQGDSEGTFLRTDTMALQHFPCRPVCVDDKHTHWELSDVFGMGQKAGAMTCSETGCWQATSTDLAVSSVRTVLSLLNSRASRGGVRDC